MIQVNSLEKTLFLESLKAKQGGGKDEMVIQNHWLNGHEFEQTPGEVKDREDWCAAIHGVHKESDTT